MDMLSKINKVKLSKSNNKSNSVVVRRKSEQGVQHGKRLNKEYAMKLRRDGAREDSSGTHGNFCCSMCGNYYGLSFGKLVKFYSRIFADAEYVCIDCLEKCNKSSYVVYK